LLLAFGIQAALILLIGALILAAGNIQDSALKQSALARDNALVAKDILAELLQARRREKDFLLRYNDNGYDSAFTAYAVPYGQHIQNINNDLEKMIAQNGANNSTAQVKRQTVTNIQVQIGVYQSNFTQVSGTEIPERERLISRFTQTSTDLKGSSLLASPSLQLALLEVQNAFSTYRWRTLPGHATLDEFKALQPPLVNEVNAKLSTLKADVDAASGDPAQKADLMNRLRELTDTFNQLANRDFTINQNIEVYRDSVHEVEPLTSDLASDTTNALAAADDAFNATQTSLRSFVVTTTVLILVVSSLLIIAISNTIYQSVSRLTEFAHEMEEGHYAQRVPVTSSDEMGRLATVFNSMAQAVLERDHQLAKAVQEAREANRLKDEFLATMSHELRTPLNAMIGFMGIIQTKASLDEKNEHRLKRARANAERLLNLINDILDISRIEAGRLQLIPKPLPIRSLVDNIRAQMAILAEDKNLRFEVEVEEDVPPLVVADEDAVMKIMTNLLGNAFKFTGQGEVRLQLSRKETEWMIVVSDTGEGIPFHMQEVIFDRFRQVDGSSKRLHGGTGLGLSIVSKLCQEMGGKVQLKSAPGQGSTFTVRLPLQETPETVALMGG
jgi:signal transduction histidine kinase